MLLKITAASPLNHLASAQFARHTVQGWFHSSVNKLLKDETSAYTSNPSLTSFKFNLKDNAFKEYLHHYIFHQKKKKKKKASNEAFLTLITQPQNQIPPPHCPEADSNSADSVKGLPSNRYIRHTCILLLHCLLCACMGHTI